MQNYACITNNIKIKTHQICTFCLLYCLQVIFNLGPVIDNKNNMPNKRLKPESHNIKLKQRKYTTDSLTLICSSNSMRLTSL